LGVTHPPPSLVFEESLIWLSSFSLFCCLNTTTKTSTTGKHLAGHKNPAKVHVLTYKLPPKPQHGRTKLSLKPQHRYPLNPNMLEWSYPLNPNMLEWSYPLNPNMLEWSYPLNPNIRKAAKREILMSFSRNFL
jgi:hypothetical protein